jgi:hypothetical protein
MAVYSMATRKATWIKVRRLAMPEMAMDNRSQPALWRGRNAFRANRQASDFCR